MEQTIYSAQINKYTVIRHVLYTPRNHRAIRHGCQQSFALRFLLLFEDRAPAHHHISALAVQLEDANVDLAIFPPFQVVHRPQFDLRSRQESAHADVNYQAALDPLGYLALDVRMLTVGFLDSFPHAPPVRSYVRQQHVAILVLVETLDFNRLARAKFNRRA